MVYKLYELTDEEIKIVENMKKKSKNIELYKEFYFFEIQRKHELNNAINLPILIISLIVSINFYLWNLEMDNCFMLCAILISSITILALLYAVYYLILSFSNFFRSHIYEEIANAKDIYDYEQKVKSDYSIYEEYIKENFAKCAGNNFEINKTRTEQLAKSKNGILVSLITTLIFCVIFTLTTI